MNHSESSALTGYEVFMDVFGLRPRLGLHARVAVLTRYPPPGPTNRGAHAMSSFIHACSYGGAH
jgi:hypothetical protein